MCTDVALLYARRVLIVAIVFPGLFLRAAEVKVAWGASASSNVTNYTLKYGTSSGSYPTTRNVGNTLTATASNLQTGVRYYFVVTSRNSSGVESDPSNELSYTPGSTPPPATNQPPTLNPIANVTILEDGGLQTINLTGISSGATSESQPLTLTATSSNPGLIPTPTVIYTSPNPTGSLRFTPAINASGSATISVTVNDGQSQNSALTRTFTVTVQPVNDAPLVNAGPDATVRLPAGLALAGSASDDGAWTARWSMVSGPGTAVFSSVSSLTGNASFPAAGQYVLRLTVSDGSLSTSDDLTVTVLPAVDLTGPVVSGLVIESLNAAGFTARWQTDEPGLCQIEYGRTTSLGSATTVEPSLSLTHRASLTNLLSATAYYYRVRSTDAAGNGSVTAVMSITTAPLNVIGWAAEAGLLTAPMRVGASDNALGKAYVFSSSSNAGTVTFPITVSMASTYQLWCRLWSPTAGSGSFQVSLDGGAGDTFDVAETGWKNGWRWVALNGRAGAAPLTVDPRTFSLVAGSHQFVFRVGEPSVLLDDLILSNDPRWTPGLNGSPPALRASASPPGQISLSWTDNTSNEDGFQIEVSRDGTSFALLALVWSGTTNYVHSGVTVGVTYYYRIYAFSDADRTDYSNVVSPQVGTAPVAPSGLVATSAPGDPVQLRWQDNSSNETGFSIERSTDGTTFAPIQSVGANVTSAVDNPNARDRYYYRVRAYNAFGSSAYSGVDSVRVR
ncbi:MAG TPA: fibronectin type III domain-containing protein [Verrucomicrobiae bacterium]|nr:fibronectin type III domain-containing protein [Verrucomicrobiae bacterium]